MKIARVTNVTREQHSFPGGAADGRWPLVTELWTGEMILFVVWTTAS